MVDKTIIIGVDGDDSGFQRSMDQVERAGKATAADVSRAFERATDRMSKDWGKVQRGAEKVFGGVIGDVADLAEGFGELGAVTGTVAAGLVAGGGIVAALYAAASASGELDASTAKLKEAWLDLRDGIGTYVAPAFNWVIENLAKITTSLKYAMLPIEGMRVLFGELAGEGKFAIDILSRQVARYGDILDALSEGNIKKAVLASQAHEQATLGMIRAHEVMPGAVKKAEDAMYALWQTLQGSEKTTHKTKEELDALARAAKKAAEEKAKLAEATAKAALWEAEFASDVEDALDAQLAADAAAIASRQERARAEAGAVWDDMIAAAYDERMQREQQLRSMIAGTVSQSVASLQQYASQVADNREAEIARIEDLIAAEWDRANEQAAAAGYSSEQAKRYADESADYLRSVEQERLDELTKQQQKSAMAAYVIQQASGLAQAAVNAVLLGSELAVALAPTLGPLAIPTAAGLAGAQGAAAAAAILAVPPPEVAHSGLVIGDPGPVASSSALAPDETMVRARRGEEIVPAGRRSQEAPVIVVNQYSHRLIDAAEGDRVRMRTSPIRQLVMAGKIPGRRG